MNEFNYKAEPGLKLNNNRDYVENNPLISVIVPFYNTKEYIKQTIISVLNQTFPYYEILIIDDGSTDKEALELLKKVELMDKRIKYIIKKMVDQQPQEILALENSAQSAKYLMFIDDDDLIEPTFMECAILVFRDQIKKLPGIFRLNWFWNN